MTDTNTTPDSPSSDTADDVRDAAPTVEAPTVASPEGDDVEAPTVASDEGDGVERGELVGVDAGSGDGVEPSGAITEPAKVMRIGSMVKQLLDEVRDMELDEPSRERLAEIYERSVVELSEALSPDLQEELRMLALPFDEDSVPTEPELRIAKAQLVGWLEGLFHGIQATLFAQQMAAQQQLEQMKQQALPHGQTPGPAPSSGVYL